MALSLALAGAVFLLRSRTWLSATIFGVGVLIKSPVPFVVLVAMGVWLMLTDSLRHRRRTCIATYVTAAIGAITAEVIRWVATPPTPETASAFSPTWYFGSLAQRLDPEFWKMILWRIAEASPWIPILAVVTPVMIVAVVLRWRSVWRPLSALLAGFFAGWLVFSNVYFVHNYYSMPVVALVYIGVGGAVSTLLRPTTNWQRAVLVALVAVGVIYGQKLAVRDLSSFPSAARYALRNVPKFALVSDDDVSGPSWGGLTGTPFDRYSTEAFEQSCERVLDQYQAVLITGAGSPCLARHLTDVSSIIDGTPDVTLWVLRSP